MTLQHFTVSGVFCLYLPYQKGRNTTEACLGGYISSLRHRTKPVFHFSPSHPQLPAPWMQLCQPKRGAWKSTSNHHLRMRALPHLVVSICVLLMWMILVILTSLHHGKSVCPSGFLVPTVWG